MAKVDHGARLPLLAGGAGASATAAGATMTAHGCHVNFYKSK
jgi:hypothetical protein